MAFAAAKVSAAYVHTDSVSDNFSASYKGLLIWDLTHSGHLAHPNGEIRVRGVSYDLVTARNMISKEFLESDAEWLLSIDSDMGFKPDSLDRLMAAAHAKERPIMGGLCFTSRETGSDGLGGYRTVPRPTILQWTELDGVKGFRGVAYYPVNRVMRCDATGAAFILIHRSVLEAIREKYGETWYTPLPNPENGKPLGEDISFCVRAGSLKFPVHVHTGVVSNHHKPQWVSDLQWWESYRPAPATEPTAVIVPTRGRPQNAKPFMESLRASTGLATAYAITSGEDAFAWRLEGANVIEADREGWSPKVNLGYRETKEPWLFFVGDDVTFWPGWLDHAQSVARMEGAKVIGTNDLANPRVMAGEHAVHFMVARDYIDSVGASWDGPGVVCHEGYKHWFADDEVVQAAKQRDVWGMALGSRVEHHHPAWGTAPEDDTYRLQTREGVLQADQKLFLARYKRSVDASAGSPVDRTPRRNERSRKRPGHRR